VRGFLVGFSYFAVYNIPVCLYIIIKYYIIDEFFKDFWGNEDYSKILKVFLLPMPIFIIIIHVVVLIFLLG